MACETPWWGGGKVSQPTSRAPPLSGLLAILSILTGGPGWGRADGAGRRAPGGQAGLAQVLLVALDRLLDAQQHGGEPLVQPGDGVVLLHLCAPGDRCQEGRPTPRLASAPALPPILAHGLCSQDPPGVFLSASVPEEERAPTQAGAAPFCVSTGLGVRLPLGGRKIL